VIFQLGYAVSARTASAVENATNLTAIYPNQATDHVRVILSEGAENASVKIITIDGRLVMDRPLDLQTGSLNVSTLPAGVYQVMLNTDGKSEIHRLVITR